MNLVNHFLEDLERGGYWDDQCAMCGQSYANTEPCDNPYDYCKQCRAELLCPGCGGEGGGITAGCHHEDGCGWFKKSLGALSTRLPEEIPGNPEYVYGKRI